MPADPHDVREVVDDADVVVGRVALRQTRQRRRILKRLAALREALAGIGTTPTPRAIAALEDAVRRAGGNMELSAAGRLAPTRPAGRLATNEQIKAEAARMVARVNGT